MMVSTVSSYQYHHTKVRLKKSNISMLLCFKAKASQLPSGGYLQYRSQIPPPTCKQMGYWADNNHQLSYLVSQEPSFWGVFIMLISVQVLCLVFKFVTWRYKKKGGKHHDWQVRPPCIWVFGVYVEEFHSAAAPPDQYCALRLIS